MNHPSSLRFATSLRIAVGAVLSAAALTCATAQSDWNNTSGGAFDIGTNWSPSGSPGDTTDVRFSDANSQGTFTVTLTKDELVRSLANRNGNVTFDLGGHTLELRPATTYGLAFDGSGGSGTTVFKNGTLLNRGVFGIGGGQGLSARTVELSNVDLVNETIAQAGRNLTIGIDTGPNGTGLGSSGHTLKLTNGSTASASALVIGSTDGGNGNTLEILSGSKVTLTGGVSIGLAGAGNTKSNNALVVDNDGSEISARYLQIGGSNATALGNNNSLTLNGGTVNISDAPGATTNYLLLTGTGISGNTVTINGGHLNVTNTAGNAYIRGTAGTSFVINGGVITTDNLRRNVGDAEFTFNAGTIHAKSSTHSGGAFTVGSGGATAALFDMSGNGTHTFSSLSIATNGELTGNGTIKGSGTNNVDVSVLGKLSAGTGDSSGLIAVTGNLTLGSSSRTTFTIGGINPVNHDRINITGLLQFNGELRLSLEDGYTPLLDDQYQLFTAGTFAGNFSLFDFSSALLAPGLSWSFDQQTGTLSVIPEPATMTLAILSLLALLGVKQAIRLS